MLAKPYDFFKQALAEQWAIGAFNASNLETSQAIIWAAQKAQAPVIVQTSEKSITYAGVHIMAQIVHFLAQAAKIPVILHLDHGKSLDTVKKCISAGYTSVMIDASDKPFAENIKIVKEVVDWAHAHTVWVEAELGAIMGKEGAVALHGERPPERMMTDPKQAQQFVADTGVDALAISVGTIHGAFSGQEHIRFRLLEDIARAVPAIPLVLHGASGIGDDDIHQALTYHVAKVNVDTELRVAFDYALRHGITSTADMIDPRDILGKAREAMQQKVEEKIRLFGSAGKA